MINKLKKADFDEKSAGFVFPACTVDEPQLNDSCMCKLFIKVNL